MEQKVLRVLGQMEEPSNSIMPFGILDDCCITTEKWLDNGRPHGHESMNIFVPKEKLRDA
jgi:hypothetical protein